MNAPPEQAWTHSTEAEQSLLGALLIDNAAWDQVADLVTAPAFFSADHRMAFAAIGRLIESGRPADVVTVSERLTAEDAERFRTMGGTAYLGALAQNTPSALNIRRYAEVVAERALLRQLYHATVETTTAVMNFRGREARELVDQAQARILDIGARNSGASFRDLRSALAEGFEFIDHQHNRADPNAPTGVPTGFIDLDRDLSGLQPGQLVILAARPSMGKSALSLNICEHAARVTARSAAYFSLEMGAREQALRLLAARAGVNLQRLFTGRLYGDEWDRIGKAMGDLQDVPIDFSTQASITVTELRALARRLARERGGLSMIVVDYVQLMVSAANDSNRANAIAEVSRGLKLLAQELQVPVLLLSQLNRELEKRVNKRPVMSDLRDSGALEQDADVILFIYRDEVYNAQTLEPGIAEILIAKQRNGPVGKVRLVFRADHTRFQNYLGDSFHRLSQSAEQEARAA